MSHRRHYISCIFGRFDDSSPVFERSSSASYVDRRRPTRSTSSPVTDAPVRRRWMMGDPLRHRRPVVSAYIAGRTDRQLAIFEVSRKAVGQINF